MGGIHIPTQEYFDRVVEICRKYEVLLMLDEVTTGFGRTGKMFAAEHWNVEPDLLALGKAMSGGYWPLGATIATDRIWEQFLGDDNTSRFNHGSTFSGHPGGSVAGLANLRGMLRDRVWETAAHRGAQFLAQLRELTEFSIVGDVRGLGMMFAVEFVEDRRSQTPLSPKAMRMLVMACFAAGIWVHVAGNTLIFMPPLNIDEELINAALARLRRVIRSAQAWSLPKHDAAA
jgi:adenosylmethionine-8-amino-7-oxononanoate aminotransferase